MGISIRVLWTFISVNFLQKGKKIQVKKTVELQVVPEHSVVLSSMRSHFGKLLLISLPVEVLTMIVS